MKQQNEVGADKVWKREQLNAALDVQTIVAEVHEAPNWD